jgi:hypothetical protein
MRSQHAVALALIALAAGPVAASPDSPAPPEVAPAAPPAAPPVPAPADTPAPAAPLAGYKSGFFIHSEDGKFALKIGGRGQVRYSFENIDAGDERVERTAFAAERVRLDLSGHAHAPHIQYKLQADFGKGFVTLKDLIIDYGVGGNVWLRAGQFKRPFSRQQLTSSGRLELVDRAITDRFFGAGRDLGVAVHNQYDKSPTFEWIAGVFNGTGDRSVLSGTVVVDPDDGRGQITGGSFSNVPAHLAPAVVVRAGYNHGGIRGYSEADLEGGPLRFAVAASALAEFDGDGDDRSGIRAEVDYIAKVEGLSTTGGVYVSTAQDGGRFRDQSFHAVGLHVQAGYVFAERFGLAARYAHVFPDAGDDQVEIGAGFSLYQFKHNFQWQTDVSALGGAVADVADHVRVRTQLQLSF